MKRSITLFCTAVVICSASPVHAQMKSWESVAGCRDGKMVESQWYDDDPSPEFVRKMPAIDEQNCRAMAEIDAGLRRESGATTATSSRSA